MAQEAIIRKQGPFIEISADGTNPLPKTITELLEEPLIYTHLRFNMGAAAYNPYTGKQEPITSEERRLFQYDANGRFFCQKGFLPRLKKILLENDYQPVLLDLDPPRVRAECYTQNWELVLSKFSFRPQQESCLIQVATHDSGIIDAVPAFGKMWVIWMICCLYPKAKIDIITKRKDVVESTRVLGTRFVPNVGQVGGGKRTPGRVTVYTADSLHRSDYDADIVLADEVHELMTDRYAELLGRYHHSRMYGFTASKETRADNAHHRMEAIFGPTIFKLTHQRAVELNLVVPIRVIWQNVQLPFDPCQNLTSLTAQKRAAIWRNDARNMVIAQAANKALEAGNQVLILVDTIDHALHLRKHLPQFELCYSEAALADPAKCNRYISWGLLDPSEPQMTSHRRDTLRRKFERRELMGVIATGVWAVGVSFDSLQVLVRANGGASETDNIQMPGRVGRIDDATDKAYGTVIDFTDTFNSKFKQRAAGRRRAYAAQGWDQYLNGRLWSTNSRRSCELVV